MQSLLWRLLVLLRIYPGIHFTYSPFKILEFEELLRGLEGTGRERVLDIGCGIGNHTFMLGRRAGSIVGVDVNPEFIARARWFAGIVPGGGKATFTTDPVEKAGFADGEFDRIFSICVLEHIPNHTEVLAHCLRSLRPGGEMIFSVDSLTTITDPELIEQHCRDHWVQQYYTPQQLRATLEDMGFVNVEVTPIFRSTTAVELFERGIRKGFNFGRLATIGVTRRLRAAEAAHAGSEDGIFLIARAQKA